MTDKLREVTKKIEGNGYLHDEAYLNAVNSELHHVYWNIKTALSAENGLIVVIHDNDPDGYMAAALLKVYLTVDAGSNSNVVFIPVAHGPKFQEYDLNTLPENIGTLIILDHECDLLHQERLSKKCGSLVVIDHHPQTRTSLFAFVLADTRWSTTALVAGFIPKDKLLNKHALVSTMVNHYDTWKFGSNEVFDRLVKCFFEGLRKRGDLRNTFELLTDESEKIALNAVVRCVEEGELIRGFQETTMEHVFSRSIRRSVLTLDQISYRVGLVFHSDLVDELADFCLKKDKDIDILAVVYLKDTKDGFKVSLRSRADTNVSIIAKRFGGGGHRQASAFQASPLTFIKFLTSLVEEESCPQ